MINNTTRNDRFLTTGNRQLKPGSCLPSSRGCHMGLAFSFMGCPRLFVGGLFLFSFCFLLNFPANALIGSLIGGAIAGQVAADEINNKSVSSIDENDEITDIATVAFDRCRFGEEYFVRSKSGDILLKYFSCPERSRVIFRNGIPSTILCIKRRAIKRFQPGH